MFTLNAEGAGKVYSLHAEGVLRDADYEALTPKLDALIEKHGALRLMCDISDVEGMEPKALWDDFVLGVRHWNDFERVAVVGDARWQEVMTKAGDTLTRGEMHYFDVGEKGNAMNWLKS